MDFRLANEMAYGNGYIPGKTNYTISYKNKGDIFFVDIQHADFRNRILKAYISLHHASSTDFTMFIYKNFNCGSLSHLSHLKKGYQ